nr:TPA_asm: hypothetical protein [Schistorhabdovirus]
MALHSLLIDYEGEIRPDKSLFDFHLKKPILPTPISMGVDKRYEPRNSDNVFFREKFKHYYEEKDHPRIYGAIFTSAMSQILPKSEVLNSKTVSTIRECHIDIIKRTFNSEVSELYKRTFDSLNDVEQAPHCIRSMGYVSLVLQSMVMWRNDYAYHSRNNPVEIMYLNNLPGIRVFKSGDNYFYEATFKESRGFKYTLICGYKSLCFVSYSDAKFAILSHDQLLLLQDTITSRWLTLKILNSIPPEMNLDMPRFETVMTIYSAGDQILLRAGNAGYKVLKFLEPLCIGLIQCKVDGKLGDPKSELFLAETLDEFYSAADDVDIIDLAEIFYSSIKNLDTHSLIQVYGTFRHWGHPTIDPKVGLKKLWSRVNMPTYVDPDVMDKLKNLCAKSLLFYYYQKHQSWPPGSTIPLSISPILHRCIIQNRLPTIKEMSMVEQKWSFVTYKNIFELPDKIPISMVLEDKAHSRSLSDLTDYLLSNRRDPLTKRLIVSALEESEIDILKLLNKIDRDGLPHEDCVIGLKAKERELKLEGRYFALMTLKMRIYFVATEWLISKYILPIFPEITMGDSFIKLQKKIFDITRSQHENERGTINFVISLDYEKWNAHQRFESTAPVFQELDKSFGWVNVITRTHEIFQKSIFYYADYKWLVPKELKPHNGFSYYWFGQYGGMEGLRQKGWTCVGILLIRYVTQRHSVSFKVLAQGDNQVISLAYKSNISLSDDIYKEEVKRLRSKTELILDEIIKVSNSIGLPVKREETWISRSIFLYGKIPVIEGSLRPSIVKIISRLYCTTNDAAPTLQNTLSSLLTACLTLTQQLSTPIIGLAIFHWYGWVLINFGMTYNVILGEPLYNYVKKTVQKEYNKILASRWSPSGDDKQTVMVLDILYRDSVIGGFGGSNLYRWLVRQFPDPLTEAISFAHNVLCTSSKGITRQIGRRFLSPLLMEEPNIEGLLQDPGSLPVQGSTKSINIMKNAVYRYLRNSPWLQSTVIRDSLRLRDEQYDHFKESLKTIKPCFPRFLSEIWGASALGRSDYFLGKVLSTNTLIQLSRTKGKMQLTLYLKKAERTLVKSWVRQCYEPIKEYLVVDCDTDHAQRLRCDGWGMYIEGATIPHPSSQWKLFEAPNDLCSSCCSENLYQREKICLYVNVDLCRNTVSPNHIGCFTPYFGGVTSEDSSLSIYGEITTDEPLLKNALHLLRTINWLVPPKSNLHKSLMNLLNSLTNAFEEKEFLEYDHIRTGSGIHRFQADRVGGGAFPGVGFTVLTHFGFNTNHLIRLGRGEENYAILFQAVISYYMTYLATLASASTPLSPVYHLHPSCTKCLFPINEIWADVPSPIVFPSLKNSTEFYIDGSLVKLYERTRINFPVDDFLSTSAESKSISCVIGILVAGYHQAEDIFKDNTQYDVINLSFFRRIDPFYFEVGMVALFMCLSTYCLYQRGFPVKEDSLIFDFLIDGAVRFATRQEIFGRLTMVFLIPEYWEYCIRNSYISNCSFPLTHNDGENILRTWAISCLTRIGFVRRVFNILSGNRLWLFFDNAYPKLVEYYHLINELAAKGVNQSTLQRVTNDLNIIRRAYPSKVFYGARAQPVALSKKRGINVLYTNMTLKTAIRMLPDIVDHSTGRQGSHWLPSRKVRSLLLWCLRDYYSFTTVGQLSWTPCSSIGIHSVRLVTRLTSTVTKVAPILETLGIREGTMYSLGDGTGGITAYLLGRYTQSNVYFNTLIDHHDEILQGTGTFIPPAVYLNPPADRTRLINCDTCTVGYTDLTDRATMDNMVHPQNYNFQPASLVICDAEFYDPNKIVKIYDNIMYLLKSIYTHDEFWLVIKLHLANEGSWHVIKQAINDWDDVRFYRSQMSRCGSSECYMCCKSKRVTNIRFSVQQIRNQVMHELAKIDTQAEYDFIRHVNYEEAWGNATEIDINRTRRSLYKISHQSDLMLHVPKREASTLEVVESIMKSFWDVSRIPFYDNDTILSKSSMEKRVSVLIGLEYIMCLILGANAYYIALTSLDWHVIPVNIVKREQHAMIVRSTEKSEPHFQLDCSPYRHVASDVLRGYSSWFLIRSNSFESMQKLVRHVCTKSQIYKFLLVLSKGNSNTVIDTPEFQNICYSEGDSNSYHSSVSSEPSKEESVDWLSLYKQIQLIMNS